jgi:hypothetical protein
VVEGVVARSDEVSLGVLVSAVSRDAVDAAVVSWGVGDLRSGGKLPAHVTAYLRMAMCLFGEDDYTEVVTKVTGSLSRWGCWDARWSVPTGSGITQARKRLVLQRQFVASSVVVAGAGSCLAGSSPV